MDPKQFIEEAVAGIKEKVGDKKVLGAVSGGVDSTVAAILTHKAIGDQLTLVFFEHELMRYRDKEDVINIFKSLSIPVEIINISDRLFQELKDVTNHDEKRKILQVVFFTELEKTAKAKGIPIFLLGTILTDIDEVKKGIKRQHNPEIDPKDYGFEDKVEPLITLRKDGVREVAKELGLEENIINRQPFPGPGFLVRMLGEATREKAEILRKASPIVEEELNFLKPFQAFPVLLGKATGIRDGDPYYGYILGIRCVKTPDAVEAKAIEVPWPALKKVELRIISDILEVVLVCYLISDKPPSTIELE